MVSFIKDKDDEFVTCWAVFRRINKNSLIEVGSDIGHHRANVHLKEELNKMKCIEKEYEKIIFYAFFEINIYIKNGILRELIIYFDREEVRIQMHFSACYFFAKRFLRNYWTEIR